MRSWLHRGDRRQAAEDGPPSHPDGLSLCGGCGHERRAHQHLRRGSDCALCPCRRYRR